MMLRCSEIFWKVSKKAPFTMRPTQLVTMFLIYILRNIIRVTNITDYKYSIFSSLILRQIILPYYLLDISCVWTHSIFLIRHVPRTTWKRFFCRFKFNFKTLKFTHYQYFWGFPLRKITIVLWLLYQSIYSIKPLSQKNKNHQIILPLQTKLEILEVFTSF